MAARTFARSTKRPNHEQRAVLDFYQEGHGHGLIEAGPGAGKCLGPDTPVLLYDGTIKAAADVRVGDLLMGPDSRPRRVLTTCVGDDEMYRITPTKGDPWDCNKAHILTLVYNRTGRRSGQVIDVPLEDWLDPNVRLNRTKLKLARVGVEFPAQPTLLPPYLAGLWLGDGTRTQTCITNANPLIVSYCREVAPALDCTCTVVRDHRHNTNRIAFQRRDRYTRRGPSRITQGFRRLLTEDRQKRITSDYLCNSRQVRLELLAGLLDTDANENRGGAEITVKDPQLRDDLLYLCRSLGFAAYAKRKVGTIASLKFSGVYWRVWISGDLSVIPTRVVQFQARRQIKNVLRTGFTVTSLGRGPYHGWTLDGDGHFLLGDYTVTHNTHLLLRCLATSDLDAERILLAAFSSQTREALARRVPDHENLVVSTLHSLGLATLKRHMGDTRLWQDKYLSLALDAVTETDEPNIDRAMTLAALVRAVMATLCSPLDEEALRSLALDHGLDAVLSAEVAPLAARTLAQGRRVAEEDGRVSFEDMLWLPAVLDLQPDVYDRLILDECQDTSAAQRSLVLRSLGRGGRALLAGDPCQAIYSFAGADPRAYAHLKEATGAQVFPLRICYRCPRSHIALANMLCDVLVPAPRAKAGTVQAITAEEATALIGPKDLILCRTTAPLVAFAYQLIAAGKAVRLLGRDLARPLLEVVRGAARNHVYDEAEHNFGEALGAYAAEQHAAYEADGERGILPASLMRDRVQAVRVLWETVRPWNVEGMSDAVQALCTEHHMHAPIDLATVHRAKGLQAKRVFLLRPDLLPHPKAKTALQQEQERHINFVALTRASHDLYFVDPVTPPPGATHAPRSR